MKRRMLLQRKSFNKNYTLKIPVCTRPGCYPFLWCCAQPSTAPRGPNVDGFILGAGRHMASHPQPKSIAGRNTGAGVDGFFFLTLGSAWSLFHILHVALSSWVRKSTLNLILLHMVC